MATAYIALGSNLANRQETLSAAGSSGPARAGGWLVVAL